MPPKILIGGNQPHTVVTQREKQRDMSPRLKKDQPQTEANPKEKTHPQDLKNEGQPHTHRRTHRGGRGACPPNDVQKWKPQETVTMQK